MQSYPTKANAVRAAKKAYPEGGYRLFETDDGRWAYELLSEKTTTTTGRRNGAVARARDIISRMVTQGAERRDIIAACVEAGINKNTAGVQYYKWTKEHAND